MSKKLVDILLLGIVILALIGLGGCASGGGSAGLVTTDPTPPPTGGSNSNSPSDERIPFDEFTQSFDDVYGNVVVTYGMSPFTTEGLAESTEKFRIADYGFMRITIDGKHNGSNEGAESTQPGPFENGGYWFEADLNGDEHVDM